MRIVLLKGPVKGLDGEGKSRWLSVWVSVICVCDWFKYYLLFIISFFRSCQTQLKNCTPHCYTFGPMRNKQSPPNACKTWDLFRWLWCVDLSCNSRRYRSWTLEGGRLHYILSASRTIHTQLSAVVFTKQNQPVFNWKLNVHTKCAGIYIFCIIIYWFPSDVPSYCEQLSSILQ